MPVNKTAMQNVATPFSAARSPIRGGVDCDTYKTVGSGNISTVARQR